MKLLYRLGFQRLFLTKKDKRLVSAIRMMVGRKPLNIFLYRLALTPSGLALENSRGYRISNERLEFLGDAILGAIIAEYLFQKYPMRDEGFLTETRSKLVNRETLNETGVKIGLKKILPELHPDVPYTPSKSLFGDMFEAFIGAIYLDFGYRFTKEYIYSRILVHLDVDGMVSMTSNFKSKIIEWSQKENKEVEFRLSEIKGNSRYREFAVDLLVDQQSIAQGKGPTKKKAEQEASKNACIILHIPT